MSHHRSPKPLFLLALLGLTLGGPVVLLATPRSQAPAKAEMTISATDVDRDTVTALKPHLEAGRQRVEQFFGKPFPKSFTVEVHPHRAAFDEYFQKRWKLPKTQAWMVASGVADRLTILSPRVWKSQAAEHNPADSDHVRDLLAHELVHVYHGQHNPKPDFDGMDEMGWFVEGLAVHVSGQLERAHRHAARDAVKAGKAPTRLADAWSGRYRYGVSGSMVAFIEQRHGRAMLVKLLPAVTTTEALRLLNTSEAQFLADWKLHVQASQ